MGSSTLRILGKGELWIQVFIIQYTIYFNGIDTWLSTNSGSTIKYILFQWWQGPCECLVFQAGWLYSSVIMRWGYTVPLFTVNIEPFPQMPFMWRWSSIVARRWGPSVPHTLYLHPRLRLNCIAQLCWYVCIYCFFIALTLPFCHLTYPSQISHFHNIFYCCTLFHAVISDPYVSVSKLILFLKYGRADRDLGGETR